MVGITRSKVIYRTPNDTSITSWYHHDISVKYPCCIYPFLTNHHDPEPPHQLRRTSRNCPCRPVICCRRRAATASNPWLFLGNLMNLQSDCMFFQIFQENSEMFDDWVYEVTGLRVLDTSWRVGFESHCSQGPELMELEMGHACHSNVKYCEISGGWPLANLGNRTMENHRKSPFRQVNHLKK